MPDLADRPMFGMGEVADETRRSPRLGIAVAAVVIAAFVAGIWYVYDRGVRRGDLKALPVITADSGPIKSSPADSGGLKVPHVDGEMPRGAVGRSGKVEDILPPPERPLPEKAQAQRTLPVDPPKVMSGADVASKAEPASPPPVAAVDVAPRPSPAAPPATPPVAVAPPAAAAKEALPPAPDKAAPAAAAPSITEKSASAQPPAAAVVAPANGRVAGAGGFRIQLASVGDRGAADIEWRRLSRANADVLGKLSPSVAAVDLPGKGTFHRLSAGPFADRGAATEACQTLNRRKVGCLVVAP